MDHLRAGTRLLSTGLPLRLTCALIVFLLTGAIGLRAGTIDFEGLTDNTTLNNQYSGLLFSNAVVLSAGISLNEFELPPHSGQNVVSDAGGPLSITFAVPVASFSGYFTYYQPLLLTAFDSFSSPVASAVSMFTINVACDPGPICLGDPGSSPNEFLSVSFSGGISRVTITGDPAGGSLAADDITYPTPEPTSLSFVLIAVAALSAARKGS